MPSDTSMLTELPLALPGRVFRSPMPFSYYDPDHLIFEHYCQEQVAVVVLLNDDSETEVKAGRNLRQYYISQGLQVIHLPIPDFSIPERASLENAVSEAIQQAQTGQNLAIHCYAGLGRTGLFAACLAKRVLGLGDDEAVRWIRTHVPGALEVNSQVDLVKKFE
jgi:protein-tyrosine phosphatase